MTEPRLIAEIRKNTRELIRIELGEYMGRATLNARVWFDAGEGEMRPSNKGLTVSLSLLPEIAAAFAKAEQIAREEGRLAP